MSPPTPNPHPLSHVDPQGNVQMVDVSAKPITVREATAGGTVCLRADVLALLLGGKLPKGDAIATARIAAMQAVKRTHELIPLCHPLAIEHIDVQLSAINNTTLRIQCTVRSVGRTGVEMEALTGATVAALTIYDMTKSSGHDITLGPFQLDRKSGGKSGPYQRQPTS